MENLKFFGQKLPIFSECPGCINMCQKASKCKQNELCKCFVHEIIKEVVFITLKQAKIDELLLALCDGRPCMCYQVLVLNCENAIRSRYCRVLKR